MVIPDLTLAVNLIKSFEAFSSQPYKDSVGKPTIGYGTTLYPTGIMVEMSDSPCTEEQALSWFSFWLSCVSEELSPNIKVQPNVNQYSALLSLAYNVGSHAVIHSTLLELFNSGHPIEAADQFPLWDHGTIQGHLVEIQGLKNRRLKEQQLFLS